MTSTVSTNEPSATVEKTPDPTPVSKGAIVGVDGSPGSAHALAWAACRVAEFGPVRPVFTWQFPLWALSDPIPSGPPLATFEQFEVAAERQAELAVASAPADICAPVSVVQGPAGQTLTELAPSADALVVGTRGRGAVADNVLGSVSGQVARTAPVPVIIVPESAPLESVHQRIIVGIDGSTNSVEALRWALTHAPEHTSVEAIYVWSHVVQRTPQPYVVPIERSEDAARETLHGAITAAQQAAGTEQAVVATLSYGDDARAYLAQQSKTADLLVLGARGHAGLAHLFLGSVTTSLLHQPLAATVVVPGARGAQG